MNCLCEIWGDNVVVTGICYICHVILSNILIWEFRLRFTRLMQPTSPLSIADEFIAIDRIPSIHWRQTQITVSGWSWFMIWFMIVPFLLLGEITSNVLRVAREARQRTLGPFSPSFNVQEILLNSLRKVSGTRNDDNVALPHWKLYLAVCLCAQFSFYLE